MVVFNQQNIDIFGNKYGGLLMVQRDRYIYMMIYDLHGGLPGMMYISRDFEVSWEYHRVYMTDLILIVPFSRFRTKGCYIRMRKHSTT